MIMYSDEETPTTVKQPPTMKNDAEDPTICDVTNANAVQEQHLKQLLKISAVAWVLLVFTVATGTSWTAAPTSTGQQVMGNIVPDSTTAVGRQLQGAANSSTSFETKIGSFIVAVNLDVEDHEVDSPAPTVPDSYPSLLEGFEWVLVGSVPRMEVASAYENRINAEVVLAVDSKKATVSLDVTMDGAARHPSGPFDPTMAFAIVGPLLVQQPGVVYGVNCDDHSSSGGLCSVHMASETNEGGRNLLFCSICDIIPGICDR